MIVWWSGSWFVGFDVSDLYDASFVGCCRELCVGGLWFDFVLGDAALVCLGCVSGFGFAGIGLRLWFYR